ncbi:MAG TPA: KH domain-containing protein [Candidatus Eisenbacteria bacterium]|nr:KH domain-containing protein [Candidatus Eisenbacteria bacterium]
MEKQAITVQKTAEKLLSLLGIAAQVNVEMQDEIAQVVVETEEGGMLIGYHGETLESFQTILSLVASREFGEFVRVNVEVGDYKRNRVEYLKHLALQAKDQALAQQTGISLSLKPWERREVHLLLENDQEVTTESMGEGRERVLVVKPR